MQYSRLWNEKSLASLCCRSGVDIENAKLRDISGLDALTAATTQLGWKRGFVE